MMTLTSDRKNIRLWIGLAGQVAVDVYTRDGLAFECSVRGIDDEMREQAIRDARKRIDENREAFDSLRSQMVP